MKRLTQNQSSGSYVDGGDKENNLQAMCEMVGGLASGEGTATWDGTLKTLTVSDTRALANSEILLCGARGAMPLSTWYVSTRSAGSFVITSGEVESASCVVVYLVKN